VGAETGTGDRFVARMGKQKEPEAKEDHYDRRCDKAQRDKVEQGANVGRHGPDALFRLIADRTRYLGGP